MERLVAFALINFFGMMSPGPDFAIVTRYGLAGSRRAAFYATIGIVLALIVHVTYCVCGVTVIIQQTPWLFLTIQLIGALYLGFLAAQILFFRKSTENLEEMQHKKAFVSGFLSNLLNPKAMFFLLSLFVQFVQPTDSFGMKMAFAITVPALALMWFGLLSYFLTHPSILVRVKRYQKKVMACVGVALMALSLYIFLNIFQIL